MTHVPTLKINSRIEILWEGEWYLSTVQDMEKGELSISIPVRNGRYLPLRVGDSIEGIYYEGEYAFKFQTAVLGRKIDRIYVIVLKIPPKLVRIQRRNFVRMKNVLEVDYAQVEEAVDPHKVDFMTIDMKRALSVDISGGGMRICTREQLDIDQKLLIRFRLKERVLKLNGVVVRVEPVEEKKWHVGIKFKDVEEHDREAIIKHIFQLARELRKNKLI